MNNNISDTYDIKNYLLQIKFPNWRALPETDSDKLYLQELIAYYGYYALSESEKKRAQDYKLVSCEEKQHNVIIDTFYPIGNILLKALVVQGVLHGIIPKLVSAMPTANDNASGNPESVRKTLDHTNSIFDSSIVQHLSTSMYNKELQDKIDDCIINNNVDQYGKLSVWLKNKPENITSLINNIDSTRDTCVQEPYILTFEPIPIIRKVKSHEMIQRGLLPAMPLQIISCKNNLYEINQLIYNHQYHQTLNKIIQGTNCIVPIINFLNYKVTEESQYGHLLNKYCVVLDKIYEKAAQIFKCVPYFLYTADSPSTEFSNTADSPSTEFLNTADSPSTEFLNTADSPSTEFSNTADSPNVGFSWLGWSVIGGGTISLVLAFIGCNGYYIKRYKSNNQTHDNAYNNDANQSDLGLKLVLMDDTITDSNTHNIKTMLSKLGINHENSKTFGIEILHPLNPLNEQEPMRYRWMPSISNSDGNNQENIKQFNLMLRALVAAKHNNIDELKHYFIQLNLSSVVSFVNTATNLGMDPKEYVVSALKNLSVLRYPAQWNGILTETVLAKHKIHYKEVWSQIALNTDLMSEINSFYIQEKFTTNQSLLVAQVFREGLYCTNIVFDVTDAFKNDFSKLDLNGVVALIHTVQAKKEHILIAEQDLDGAIANALTTKYPATWEDMPTKVFLAKYNITNRCNPNYFEERIVYDANDEQHIVSMIGAEAMYFNQAYTD